MSSPQVNGTGVNHHGTSSITLQHILSYPVVDDSVKAVKSNQYAQQGISMSHGAYKRVRDPMAPYLETPYSYVQPYLQKADEIGDWTLKNVDAYFPIITKPTDEAIADIKGIAMLPIKGRDHAMNTYSTEKQKQGDGMIPFGKAVAVTILVLMTQTAEAAKDLLSQTVAKGSEAMHQAREKAD